VARTIAKAALVVHRSMALKDTARNHLITNH
jgi:hypothetical protein